jgi:hypothetical protein
MTICFSLAQEAIANTNRQAQTLMEFNVNGKNFDLSGDQSNGAVWKAGKHGLEPNLFPALNKKGVLFLADMRTGIYPKYDANQKYKTYEGLLNGQRYAITFTSTDTATGWAPFTVVRISEFTAVKQRMGGSTAVSPVVSSSVCCQAPPSPMVNALSSVPPPQLPPKPMTAPFGCVALQQPHPASLPITIYS